MKVKIFTDKAQLDCKCFDSIISCFLMHAVFLYSWCWVLISRLFWTKCCSLYTLGPACLQFVLVCKQDNNPDLSHMLTLILVSVIPFSADFSNVPNTTTACQVTALWGLRRKRTHIHLGKSSRPWWRRNSGWLPGTRTRATPSHMLRQLLMHINSLLFFLNKQTKHEQTTRHFFQD